MLTGLVPADESRARFAAFVGEHRSPPSETAVGTFYFLRILRNMARERNFCFLLSDARIFQAGWGFASRTVTGPRLRSILFYQEKQRLVFSRKM